MKIVLKNVKIISVFVLMLSFLGCASDDDENLPQVVAGFTKTIDDNTGVVTFINTSDNANNYQWDFGDETTSTEINPIKKFENGTYVVSLLATNVAGGSGLFTDTLTISIKELMSLPATFDDSNINYKATPFNGAQFEIVDNPDASGSNPTVSKVGEIINRGTAFEGVFWTLGTSIDLATNKTIGMNFWSEEPIEVLLKLEEGNTSIEQTTDHDGTGWETIYFNFNSESKFSVLTLFVDNTGSTSGSFFIDDIFQTETLCRETDLLLPIDFDCQGTVFSVEAFGGTAFEVIENPELSGINEVLSNVGEITNSGATFEGITFFLDVPADLSDAEAISLKMFSSVAVPVLLKLDGEEAIEASSNHDGTGWKKLTFDFDTNEEFDQLSILIDVSGTTAGSFYIDDVMLDEGSDRVAPVITLIGEAIISVVTESTFTDPGATAIDNVDGDISDQIVVGGDVVDTSVEGTYTITYNVTDAAGNSAAQVERTVNVASTDTQAPVITLVGDATINITVGDTFNDPGATATDNVDGDITANIVVTGTVDTNTAGNYTLRYNVSDVAGNAANEVTRTVVVATSDGPGDNLLVNGDFEEGNTAWYGNAFNPTEEGGNTYNFANVATAGNPFDVNLSQLVTLVPGSTYTLTFDASSDGNRTMIVGIGQSADPFYADTEVVNLTNTTQTFTLELSAVDDGTSNTFGDATSRVIFDMGAAVGVVVIDNVSLILTGDGGGITPPPSGDNILTNGDFESGSGDGNGWLSFNNGGTAAFDNTINNGGSFSGKLATNGASNPGFKQERVGIGTVQAGDVVQVSFDHIGSLTAPEGGVFNVLLFVERAEGEPGDPITHIFDPRPTLSDTWSTFTATYNIPSGASVTGGISILIESVCGGAPGCSVSANIDNVSVVLNP